MPINSVGGGSYADSSKTESTTRTQQAPASSTLTMDNFMLLLAAELQNQDMSNPMSNSEMMQQLTSMATVQSMNTFSELSSTQYAISLMGKEVKVASTNKDTGKMEMKSGVIAGVNLSSMSVYIEGDNAAYGLGNIMEIGKVPEPEDDKDDDDKDDDDKDDGTTDPPDTTKPDSPDTTKPDSPDTTKPDSPDTTKPDSPDTTKPDPDDDKTNNSKLSRAALQNTAPENTAGSSRAGRTAAEGPVSTDLNSRTDPVTGRTARRVVKEGTEYTEKVRTSSSGQEAAPLSGYGRAVSGKTYTDTRALRMEYLASDKRDALERQLRNEIPEDKRMALAKEAAATKATGPAAYI